MRKKKLAVMTGLLSTLGFLTYLGHRKQVEQQEQEQTILAEVRAFFAPMGSIAVVYANPGQTETGATTGGIVFDDGVVFEFHYHKGDIDYRQVETMEDNHE